MRVPTNGIVGPEGVGVAENSPTRAQLLMAAAILAKDKSLAPDEDQGLKGANADAARWRK